MVLKQWNMCSRNACRQKKYAITIWTERNKLLHEGQHSTATVNFIKHYLGEVDGGRDKSVVCRVPIVSWKLPQEHFVKINFDAGFCQQNNKSCSEIIIPDDSAEGMACFQATEIGFQLGFLVWKSNVTPWLDINTVFHYVPKHANGVARLLATEGLKRNVETYLAGAIPSFAHKAVEVDRQQLGY
ncbi:hypothetical protein Gotri_025047 [Gossypium trilobum]|uniref:RNase H type-1 domain-containing protein n=1 Tax=Gossypium trilobum TaxID=34281 RepID=A0A7J9FUH4_9ROSI|nr:hypothetical protein [Gossypium trilobum]